MNCQCSSAVGFHLLDEMPLFSIFEGTVSFQTKSRKNASEEKTFFPQEQPSCLSTTFLNS